MRKNTESLWKRSTIFWLLGSLFQHFSDPDATWHPNLQKLEKGIQKVFKMTLQSSKKIPIIKKNVTQGATEGMQLLFNQTRHPVPHTRKAKCPSWHYCGTTIIIHLVSKHLGFLDLTYPKTVYLFRFHPCFSGFSDTTPKQATCTLLSDACLSLQPQGLLYLWGA